MIPLRDDNPVQRIPVLTYLLVAANLAAFVWQLGLPGSLQAPDAMVAMERHLARSVLTGGLVPYELLTLSDVGYRDIVPPPFTIFTSMFLHGGLAHIAFNMLFLWIFGNNVEDALGRIRYLAFYLACGIVAALAQVVAAALSGELRVPMVGASGAIAGVLAAYMVLFPRTRVSTLVFFFVVPVPAVVLIGLWFLLQLRSIVFGGEAGVAFVAHVGGFLAGLFLLRVMGRRRGYAVRRRAYW